MTYDDAIAAIAESVDPGVITAEGIDHLSYSSLSLLENCSEKWRQRYILKKKIGKSFPMAVGNGIHRGVERYHQGDPPEAQLESAKAKFRKELPHAETYQMVEADAAMERMLNAYRAAYTAECAATEREVDIPIGSGLTIRVVIDLVKDGAVKDLKSTTRARKNFHPDEMQLLFGLLGMYTQGVELDKAAILPIRRDVTGQRAAIVLEPFEFDATPEWIETNTLRAVAAIRDVQARLKGELWDGPPHEKKWMCSRCDHAPYCPVLTAPVQFVGSRI